MTSMNKTGKKKFLIDMEKCTSCQLCVIACKDEHVGADYLPWTKSQPQTGHFWIDVHSMERGQIPRVKMSYLPMMCQHCDNAACVKACPEDAIKRRDDGLVWIDQEKCTGCGMCEDACPYDVIFMNQDVGVAQKCTGCAHRVDAGSLPRCAEVCPHDVILFADEDDAAFLAAAADAAIHHPEFEARPRVLWKGLPQPWIAGAVFDAASDDLLADVEVTAVDLFDDSVHTARTDAFGDFRITGLRDGRKYLLHIRGPHHEEVRSVVTCDGDQDLGTIALIPQ